MHLKQRKRHRLIWGIMALLLPLLFIASLWVRPKEVMQPDPLPRGTADSLSRNLNSN